MNNKQDVLRTECESHGFTFDTYSPGDGMTRYRFFPRPEVLADGTVSNSANYFAGDGDYTALGWKEALAYATGRVHGWLDLDSKYKESKPTLGTLA